MRYWLIFSNSEEVIPGSKGLPCQFSNLKVNKDTYELEQNNQSAYIKLISADTTDGKKPLAASQSKMIDIELPDDKAVSSAKQLVGQWLQLEAFLSDLSTLEKNMPKMPMGNNPWTLAGSLSRLSRLKATLAEIRSRVETYSGPISTQVDPKVLTIGSLVGSIDSGIERKYWEIQSRTVRVNFIFALIGIVIGFALSLLGRLIL